jgi:hypothetical protein
MIFLGAGIRVRTGETPQTVGLLLPHEPVESAGHGVLGGLGAAEGPNERLASADVAALLRWQERLVRRLRCPGERGPRAPKAVITIDARDRQRAVAEAIAAVEAML